MNDHRQTETFRRQARGSLRRRGPLPWGAALVAALLLLTSLVAPRGQARAEEVKDLDAPVEAGSKITYRKLIGAVFKGAKEDQSGDFVTAGEKVLRRIGEAERTVLPEGTRLTGFDVLRVRGDGKRYIVLAITAETDATEVVGGGAFVLADFPEGSAEPQDVAEMKADRFCYLAENPGPVLGPDDGILVQNSHSNSNQGYLITNLYHIHGGRFRQIDSIFTLSVQGACENSFLETLVWKTEEDEGSPYPKVVATVTLVKGPREAESSDCPKPKKPAKPEVYTETYRWDKAAGRYTTGGKGLATLEAFNEKNL